MKGVLTDNSIIFIILVFKIKGQRSRDDAAQSLNTLSGKQVPMVLYLILRSMV